MNCMKTAIVIVAIVAIAGAVYIGTRPESFRIERSAQINAPPAAVFALVSDFHQWAAWSPYEKLDPNMKKTFEGPATGPGAVYAWEGNSKAGAGRMTVLESKPGELILVNLEFTKPFAAKNLATFTFTPSGAGTRVTWSMEGKNTLMSKALSPFMDGMVGGDFEKGLANLDAAVRGHQ